MIFDINELILNTEDYSFTPFSHQGFGGKTKYIATPKIENLPKLLVKHKGEFAPPCNGFIYGRLGQLLGINVPKTYMMNVSEQDRNLFESNCVVGMEFLDGLQPPDIKKIKEKEYLRKQLIHCFLLAGLFTHFEDNLQCVYIPDQAVYPIDFDDSFGLEYPVFNAALQDNELAEWLVKRQLEISCQHNLDTYLKVSVETSAKQLGISTEEVTNEFVSVLQRFYDLGDDELTSVTDALMEFFPPLLAVYYEEYIHILQKKAATYISKNKISG